VADPFISNRGDGRRVIVLFDEAGVAIEFDFAGGWREQDLFDQAGEAFANQLLSVLLVCGPISAQ
jgi:hypothetical protein